MKSKETSCDRTKWAQKMTLLTVGPLLYFMASLGQGTPNPFEWKSHEERRKIEVEDKKRNIERRFKQGIATSQDSLSYEFYNLDKNCDSIITLKEFIYRK